MNNSSEDPFGTPDPAALQPQQPFPGNPLSSPLDIPGQGHDVYSIDPFANDIPAVTALEFTPEAVTPASGNRRMRIIGAAVATAAVAAGGGMFALRGGSAGSEAIPSTTAVEMQDNSHVSTIVPETSTTMAPVTIAAEQPESTSTIPTTTEVATAVAPSTTEAPTTTAAPTTTEAPAPAPVVNPFERTGVPEQDAVLSWFEQASQNTHVVTSNVEFDQPAASSGLFGMDQNELMKDSLDAQFEFSFLHDSGLQVNVYTGNVNGAPDIELNADAIAMTMDFVQSHVRQENRGLFNEQEMSFIENLAQTQALAGKGINFIFVDRNSDNAVDACLEELATQGTTEVNPVKCTVAGSTTVLYGGIQSNSLTIAIQVPQYYPEQGLPQEVENNWQQIELASVIAHEYGHSLAELSGASDRIEAPVLERATQEASANGYRDAAVFNSLFQEYITPVIEAEHTNYVNQIEQAIRDAAGYNTDDVLFVPAVPGVSEATVVTSSGPNVRIVSEGRIPYVIPPIVVNS